jgi:hypothetical protein
MLLSTTSLRRMREWRYSATILELGTRWCQSGQLHALAALLPASMG